MPTCHSENPKAGAMCYCPTKRAAIIIYIIVCTSLVQGRAHVPKWPDPTNAINESSKWIELKKFKAKMTFQRVVYVKKKY